MTAPKSSLRAAIDFSRDNHPLPRCQHGHALQDHSGELLEPACGCRQDEPAFGQPFYRMESDRYLWCNEKGEVQDAVPEVAIAYDAQSGTILKCGREDMVKQVVDKALASGLFPYVRMVTFKPPFPVGEVNRCRSTTGYILRLMRRISAGEFDNLIRKPWQTEY